MFIIKKYLPILSLLIVLPLLLMAQKMPEDKSSTEFRSPLDIKLLLSGTFAELRSNHFHSGIDIKTGGVIGKPVYAIMDGYVTRIKVSPYGYGKALYIDHPGGITSVYGHLSKYNETIGEWIEGEQYRRESFAFDANLHPGQISVKKGDIIAWTGNSGGSGGPHLHFEIRDAASQEPLNPLRYGFGKYVKDYIRPTLQRIKIYALDESSTINGKNKSITYAAKGWGENYRIEPGDTIVVGGKIGFGVQVYDLLNNASNHNGIRLLELYLDEKKIFSYVFNRFSFAETRYINSLIDYEEYIRYKRRIQKSFLDPYNKLSVYDKALGNGVVYFKEEGHHKIRYVIKDHFDNVSEISFPLKSKPPNALASENLSATKVFYPDVENIYQNENIYVKVSTKTLYDTLYFKCDVAKGKESKYSKAYHVHNLYTPANKRFEIRIKPDSLTVSLRRSALLVHFSKKGKWVSAGGKFENGHVTARVREFGMYRVAIDTIPPRIKPVNIYNGKKISQSKISFEISDNLSGVKHFRGEINGKWVLMEYDPKRRALFYRVDSRLPMGKSTFTLKVTDGKGNVANYTASISK